MAITLDNMLQLLIQLILSFWALLVQTGLFLARSLEPRPSDPELPIVAPSLSLGNAVAHNESLFHRVVTQELGPTQGKALCQA